MLEPGHHLPVQPKGRHAVGDALFGLGHDLEDRLAQSLEGPAFGFVEGRQVVVDLLLGHASIFGSGPPTIKLSRHSFASRRGRAGATVPRGLAEA